ncbi:hypothetical protein ABIC28_005108 [Rhodococcus sp. PvR044]|uniref:DUF3560 domain-containing protein n=1 Tax=Rhodococcus sp. PvR044 TaxID=3156402 RepID=UPI0033976B1C
MSALTITHTPAEGTLIDGTSRGDTAGPILKARGWRWSRNLESWYVPRSRDVAPKRVLINMTTEKLREAGYTVDIDIDASYRTTAEVEADKITRQAARVDALDAKADRKSGAADAAWEADKKAHAALPEFGEPIKVGHHSEGRHRRAVDKAWNALGKAVHAQRDAATARGRADAAAKTTDARYAPNTVARRIEKLTADRNRFERARDGYTRTLFTHPQTGQKQVEIHEPADGAYREQLDVELARVEDEIAYWSGVREQQLADGKTTAYSRDVIVKGDRVAYNSHGWHEVLKVNAKSVTIPSIVGGTWTDRVPYTDIRGLHDETGATVRIVDGARVIDTPAA